MACRLMPNWKNVIVMDALSVWVIFGTDKIRTAGKDERVVFNAFAGREKGNDVVRLRVRNLTNKIGASYDHRAESCFGPSGEVHEERSVIDEICLSSEALGICIKLRPGAEIACCGN